MSQIPFEQNPNPHQAPGKRRRRGRWSEAEEDEIVRLRESGKGWTYIGNQLHGRTATGCRQNYWRYLTDKTDKPLNRRGKWSQAEEDEIVRLRESGKGWKYIGNKLAGRTAAGCSKHYWSYLVVDKTDKEKRIRLASVYERHKSNLWNPIANELGISWQECEAMHWAIGRQRMARLGALESTQVSESRDLTPFRSPSVDGCEGEEEEDKEEDKKEDEEEGEEEDDEGDEDRGPRSKRNQRLVTSDQSKSQRTTSNMARSASRSSSYSPPSPSVPEAPKALRCDTTKSEATSQYVARKLPTDLSISDCLSLHSPIAAPWNDHHFEITVLGDDNDCPAKRARIASSTDSPLPEFIDRCDNYGCNSFHSHFDCPLEKKCWGCRSKNHFTSDCPMTCTYCCSEGHTREHCEDFENDPYTGIARPRRSFKPGSSANTILPVLSQSKIYQCDNYGCNSFHSHWDCPLPAICWGCRSSKHFWSMCRERCGKCGAQRHISKYCHEFQMWRNGIARPIRRPDDIATDTIKRKRENEMQENGPQHSQGFERAVYPTPTPTSQYASTPLQQPPAKHCTATPRHEYGEFTIAGSSSKVHTESLTDSTYPTSRTPPAYIPITRETFPSRTHDENGNKIYCTFWLRTGRCAFEATPRGCTLKHKIPPGEATQREIGINISAPWLRNDPVVQETRAR